MFVGIFVIFNDFLLSVSFPIQIYAITNAQYKSTYKAHNHEYLFGEVTKLISRKITSNW